MRDLVIAFYTIQAKLHNLCLSTPYRIIEYTQVYPLSPSLGEHN